jgi:DNA polymerase II small subunit
MMQQQILEKKKEIINSFLKKGILVSSDLLSKLNDDRHISKIFEILKANDEDITVADFDIHNLLEKAKQQETKPEQKTASENKVEIIYSYKEESKKREAQDFVAYFNIRYKSIEKILKHHQELKNTISISRLTAKKEQVSIIGMVSAKQTTKNGNLLLMVEDPTGQRRVLVNKNKPSLFREAQSIVLDEVIGIVGTNVDTLMFANNIVWPEAPNTKELRKMDEEKYAIFLSDIHVGSTNFLPDEFEKFLKWINGEAGNETQKNIAKKVHYIFIAGDLVDGVGIYPGQEEELTIKDIYEQYKECARLLDKIPKRIKLIISPGNHDAMRLAEPQPLLSKEFAKPLHELSNVIMVLTC